MKWFLLVWQRFAEFGGRSRRLEYWMFVLFYWIILLVLGLGVVGFPLIGQSELGAFCTFIGTAYGLVALVPGLSCAVRRLHDTGKSGWWILLVLVPIGVAPLFGYAVFTHGPMMEWWVPLGFALIAALVLAVLLALDGTAGPNRYGPDPKARELPAAIG